MFFIICTGMEQLELQNLSYLINHENVYWVDICIKSDCLHAICAEPGGGREASKYSNEQ